MSEQAAHDAKQAERKLEERREFQAHVWGIGLALLLTLVPFALVRWVDVPRLPLLIVIGVSALVQVIVHFHFFLHISLNQNREDLQLILFSILVLTIMVAGTVWIMANLALRMAEPAAFLDSPLAASHFYRSAP